MVGDVKYDWQWDTVLQSWVFAAQLGEHYFIYNVGKKSPLSEPGYIDYLCEKAKQAFKEQGVY